MRPRIWPNRRRVKGLWYGLARRTSMKTLLLLVLILTAMGGCVVTAVSYPYDYGYDRYGYGYPYDRPGYSYNYGYYRNRYYGRQAP
jgi:hypothetical protein